MTKDERLREEFTMHDLRGEWTSDDSKKTILKQLNRKLKENFIPKEEIPKGISEWLAFGKKRGYDKYFLEGYIPRGDVEKIMEKRDDSSPEVMFFALKKLLKND